MQLSKRLTAVSELITSGYRLADVGTDHGYIPIKLVLSHKIPSAIAMDVNKGPLERAAAHIREYGLQQQITTRLSDGLEKLEMGEADTVLIAGMGGMLTVRILERGREVLESVKELILQPQSDIRQVRLFLKKEGFQITDEDMVEEDGKFYPMMRTVKAPICETVSVDSAGEEREKTLSNGSLEELQLLYGPCLLNMHHPVLLQYLQQEHRLLERVKGKLEQEKSEGAVQRLAEIRQALLLNEQAADFMK